LNKIAELGDGEGKVKRILTQCLMVMLVSVLLAAYLPNKQYFTGYTGLPQSAASEGTDAREYGETERIKASFGSLMVSVRYPQGGNSADGFVADWAQNVIANARNEMEMVHQTNPQAKGEVSVQYESYQLNSGYAGVIESGLFYHSQLEQPQSIVMAFNVDTVSGLRLENADILDKNKIGHVLELLKKKILNKYPSTISLLMKMDESWLANMAISHDGIIVILERGKYLPVVYGDLRFTLTYEELGDAVLLGIGPTASLGSQAGQPSNFRPLQFTDKREIDPALPMVALTFDDGPCEHTGRILDILERYQGHARVTFFVNGYKVNSQQETVRRAYDLGNEVASHFWDHRDLTRASSQDIRTGLWETNNVLQSINGEVPMMYRPPYGAINNNVRNVSRETGFAMIQWSVDTLDWRTRNADLVYNAIMRDVKDRAIILCHDLHLTTALAMERVIPELLEQGYQLVTVSEMFHYSGVNLEPGKVYYSGN